ncbi:MAG: hypothetical protein KatS3mg059_0295 [Thermomicrobiales bacterium]|nr:MAG: hypothetical protein KatS3mg059_0295 [Thermomicrobiales bacterium]
MSAAPQRLEFVVRGDSARPALAAALARSLELLTGEVLDPDGELPDRAVPLRASGSHLPAVACALIEALADEVVTSAHRVRAVRLDGLLEREDGFRAWAYAYLDDSVPGQRRHGWLESLTVSESSTGEIVICASLLLTEARQQAG